ncbi:hypothetical protein BCR41DRAFT_350180 [Lobosporangium transversale]|uniref:C2H2-type domain-containing protein n=1 Tax=Lobosporangium transversale TaxID=64571 RepID=A0A1Y2GV50_9FUNG|nr:hypothetical protein BCR41DRAFT_350180 [Lobosporangium transversale]ORZ21888.1 hypothetical protein BCR41DRAFT_350180 [Lobosporangium transversale]|eukprot:XP_021883139.1 hypothetical protein BCR41DRAFT_350180 [Lobosporangium transversale]
MPSMGGIPLLSPTSMLQSEYQPSSYSMDMHETPTIMSHVDYSRVGPSMAPTSANGSTNTDSRYGPIRVNFKKSRTPSLEFQRGVGYRTRTNSVNSTSSSVASSGVLSLTTALDSASFGTVVDAALTAPPQMQSEEEDSDSPTTILMRPRTNAIPRKAIAARVFECSVPGCAKAYTQLHNLKSHERTGHTPVIKLKPFHCIVEGCCKAFSQRKSLALHIKTAHADFKFKPFKCTQGGCTKAYTQLHNLRTHEKTVHLVDLSRKRIKNPSMDGALNLSAHIGGPSSYSSPFVSLGGRGQHPTHMPYGPHSTGLGLTYDGLSNFSLGHGSHGENPYHYQRQHGQSHHHPYARLPHPNPMSGMYAHRS